MARKVWRLTDLPAIFSKGDFYSGGVRCLLPELKYSTNGVRRSGIQLELELASTFPLLRTPPEGFCSSSYKDATPNGVKPVTLFFTTSAVGGISEVFHSFYISHPDTQLNQRFHLSCRPGLRDKGRQMLLDNNLKRTSQTRPGGLAWLDEPRRQPSNHRSPYRFAQ